MAAAACVCLLSAVLLPTWPTGLGPPSAELSPVERTTLGLYLLVNRGALVRPGEPPFRQAAIDIEPGMDAGAVATELHRLGVLEAPELFRRYLRYRGLDTTVEAGRYQVSSGMSIVELADMLQQARASRYTITIPEGWRREEIAEALGALGLSFTPADFLAATRRPPPAWAGAPPSAKDLEGFLFPDTYQLGPEMSASDVAQMMLETFEARVGDSLRAGFAAQGLTTFEAVTLASIVEREAAVAAERPLIASVFLNRLDLGIPLQADPTVQYALGRSASGWWKAPLTADDLGIDSLYNTYRYAGLPPGPIASPGLAALASVADPTPSGYLFFRAACDGSGAHLFATTFEDHLRNACP